MNATVFVVRVYGIYRHPEKGILVSDETVLGKKITKFPGGGMEYGEGTIECLIREMMEETGSQFKVLSHFYTTDFFVESAFEDKSQIISIYYLMEPVDELLIRENENGQEFRFIEIEKLSEKDFGLPIDRHVVCLLLNRRSEYRHEKNHPSGK